LNCWKITRYILWCSIISEQNAYPARVIMIKGCRVRMVFWVDQEKFQQILTRQVGKDNIYLLAYQEAQ
jgi:hypothetical protein